MTETGNGITPGLALLEKLEGNKLVTNIMHFGRILRSAGLPVGPGKILDAVSAVQTVSVTNRRDFYWALHAVFVNRRDQHEIFDQAFHIFWRDPRLLERMLGLLMPQMAGEEDGPEPEPPSRRVAEAMSPSDEEGNEDQEEKEPELEVEATLTASANELLQKMDFEDMSAAEIAKAKAAISRMRLTIQNVKTRRFQASHRLDKIDMRSTLRAAMRTGGTVIPLQYRTRRKRTPPLVILCDISGSMGRYTRMLLHFMHAITNDRDRVSTFLFGTRLTNVTRHLRNKDIDIALTKCTESVEDWSGGTRIGVCLKQFNNSWSRRVLSQGAICILVTDGLDRDEADGLEKEMERLSKSARQLIWLNPLLRFDGFEPKAKGIKTMLPYVDEFKTAHNLKGLLDLSKVLSRPMKDRRVYSEIFNA